MTVPRRCDYLHWATSNKNPPFRLVYLLDPVFEYFEGLAIATADGGVRALNNKCLINSKIRKERSQRMDPVSPNKCPASEQQQQKIFIPTTLLSSLWMRRESTLPPFPPSLSLSFSPPLIIEAFGSNFFFCGLLRCLVYDVRSLLVIRKSRSFRRPLSRLQISLTLVYLRQPKCEDCPILTPSLSLSLSLPLSLSLSLSLFWEKENKRRLKRESDYWNVAEQLHHATSSNKTLNLRITINSKMGRH